MFNFILPKIRIEVERWKWNKNYKLYVSNLGNFKDATGEIIKPKVESKGGYLVIPICNNKEGIVKYIFCHRIVMETWCPKAEMWKEKLTVDHLDHNKRNNKKENLEWVTKDENNKRAKQDFLEVNIREKNNKNKMIFKENIIIAKNTSSEYKFINEEDAFKMIRTKCPSAIATPDVTLRNRIINANRNNKQYCGFKWILERKGE